MIEDLVIVGCGGHGREVLSIALAINAVSPIWRVRGFVVLGRHVHVNQNATVGHDCVLEDYVSVNPLAAVSGECHVESGALIGATAAVLEGRRVGRDAVVGAGACAVHDVEAGSVVKGIPAR